MPKLDSHHHIIFHYINCLHLQVSSRYIKEPIPFCWVHIQLQLQGFEKLQVKYPLSNQLPIREHHLEERNTPTNQHQWSLL
jgi:hypothetical protein